jgi:succinoglycan biosynthesis protein ExoA
MTIEVKPSSNPETIIPGRQYALFISVIVPIRNEAKHIEHVLDQLVHQDYDHGHFEIIVVDGVSTDGTPDLVANFAKGCTNIRLFSNPQRLSSAARNIGIRQARGEVVLIVDGHCELEDDKLLCKVAEAFERSGADCLGRPQPLDLSQTTPLQRAIAIARSSRLGHHPDSFIYSKEERFVPAISVAVAYRREVFDKVGYFDEHFDACEDVELNHRIDKTGLRCFFTYQITVGYRPRTSLTGLFYQLVRYGRGRMRLMRKHPKTTSLGTFAPVALLAWICLCLALSAISTNAAIVGATTVGAYLCVLFMGAIILAIWHADGRFVLYLPIIWIVIHFSAAIGILYELILGLFPSSHGESSENPAKCTVDRGPSSDLTKINRQNNSVNGTREHILPENSSNQCPTG